MVERHVVCHGGSSLTSKCLYLQKYKDIWSAILTTFGLVSGGFDPAVVYASQSPVAAGILAVLGVFAFAWVSTLT